MPFQEAEVSTSRIDGEHTFAQGWVGVKTAKAGEKRRPQPFSTIMQTSKDSVLGAEAGGSKESPHPDCGQSQRGPTPVHPPNTAFECQG